MKKRFLKRTLCALLFVVMFTMSVSMFCLPASAASYPSIFIADYEVLNSDHFVGYIVPIKFTYFPEYHNEKIHVSFVDSKGNQVSYADRQFYNSDYDSYVKDYTVTWNTKDLEPGEYKIIVSMEFYSFNRWNECPRTNTFRITLKPWSDRVGWVKYMGNWQYVVDGVAISNKWYQVGSKWYFFDENGYMLSDKWKKDSVGWVYLGSDGAMKTNAWVQDSVGWCYLGADGYAVTNCWKKDYKGWCYLNSDGQMVTNKWVKDYKGWCYVGADGYMKTSMWVKDYKGWCYVGADGYMKTNAWVEDSAGWCYVGADGYAVTNCWKKDYKGWCYLDANGRMITDDWVEDTHGLCYLDENGYWDGIYH